MEEGRVLVRDVSLVWRHVGWQHKSPWMSGWHFVRAELDGYASLSLLDLLGSTLLVFSEGKGASQYRGLAGLQKEKRWDLAFFCLTKTSRPVGTFLADRTEVGPLQRAGGQSQGRWGNNGMHLVWNPFGRDAEQPPEPEARPGAPPAPGTLEAEFAELEDAAAEG